MLVVFGLNGPFISVEKIGCDSLIPKICKITSSSSFLCCLPYCLKGIIPICIIATVHKSLILAGFLQHCVETSFVKRKKKERKKPLCSLHYHLSCQPRLIFGKMFHANFTFYPRLKILIISIFFESLCLAEALYQPFHGRCWHKVGV